MSQLAVTRTLSALALLAGALGLLLLVALALPPTRRLIRREVTGERRLLLGTAWVTALVASAGSLYYSEVAGFVPCVLCWYQRIAMYPLVLVLGVGTFLSDRGVWRYTLPLSVTGLGIAVYHILIQFRPALDAGMCQVGVPCSMRYVSGFGFVSIPVMAAGGFLLVTALALVAAIAHDGNFRGPDSAP